MSNKISYTNLKLKLNNNKDTFMFNNNKIEILQYLPTNDKYDLVMITLQKSEENGIYNSIKLDIYFHLHLIYMYTNLTFTDKQKEDEFKLYDTLKSNGFIDSFLEVINEEEYKYLFCAIQELIKYRMAYKNSAAAVLQSLIQDLPKNAQIASDIVESFDKEKFKAVVDFAEAANGGRPITVLGQPIHD